MNLVITNLKGGVGKTTTGVYLAAVAAARGHAPVFVVSSPDSQVTCPTLSFGTSATSSR